MAAIESGEQSDPLRRCAPGETASSASEAVEVDDEAVYAQDTQTNFRPVAPPLDRDWVGHRIGAEGRYEVESFVGRGGMASVFAARDSHRRGKRVAIKVPLPQLLDAPSIRARFEREFHALIQLEHPHICGILDTGTYLEAPFVVLPYLSGGTLHQRFLDVPINQFPRTIDNLFKWLLPIAEAIDFVHQNNYLHRDIKPDNILFDEHGRAFLGDFGIVRALNEPNDHAPSPGEQGLTQQGLTQQGLTQQGLTPGTPGYMAPEFQHQPLSGRSDLYSLAAVVYRYLTNEPPLARDEAPGTTPRPPHELNTTLPAVASEILLTALDSDPQQRPDGCLAFARRLQLACGQPPQVSHRPVTERWRRARPGRWVLAGTVALAAAAGVAAIIRSEPTELPSPDPPPKPREDARQDYDNGLEYLAAGEEDDALQSFNQAVARDPQPRFYAARGESLRQLGHYDEALQQFSLAVADEPTADHYAGRALVHLDMGQLDEAVADLDQAIALESTRPRYFGYRGWARLRQNRDREAIPDFTAALRLANSDVSVQEKAAWHNARGTAHSRIKQWESARDDATHAIQLEPRVSRHWRNRAGVQRALGNLEAAARDLREAEQLEQ